MADGNDHLYAPGRPSTDHMIIVPRNVVETGNIQIHRDVRVLDGMEDEQEYVTLHTCQKTRCDAVATFLAYNTKRDLYVCKEHLADAMAFQTETFSIIPKPNGFEAGLDHAG